MKKFIDWLRTMFPTYTPAEFVAYEKRRLHTEMVMHKNDARESEASALQCQISLRMLDESLASGEDNGN
jgi:hypothetical protein